MPSRGGRGPLHANELALSLPSPLCRRCRRSRGAHLEDHVAEPRRASLIGTRLAPGGAGRASLCDGAAAHDRRGETTYLARSPWGGSGPDVTSRRDEARRYRRGDDLELCARRDRASRESQAGRIARGYASAGEHSGGLVERARARWVRTPRSRAAGDSQAESLDEDRAGGRRRVGHSSRRAS